MLSGQHREKHIKELERIQRTATNLVPNQIQLSLEERLDILIDKI